MARELVIVWAGRHQRDAWETLCAGYRRRIERFVPIRDVPVRVRKDGDDRTRLRLEGEALLAAAPGEGFGVALDRRGKAMDSLELARFLARLRSEWPHAIVFRLGSDLGLAPGVLEDARLRLSLGPMTLPHELARLVLYEQLYRALTIEAGISYHRGPLH